VVYYRGEAARYYDEFYEPYQHYPRFIFAIPGNHDGVIIPGDPPSLTAFVRNFCSNSPQTVSPDVLSTPRYEMTQPYVYWTLDTPLATIIGLYSNVSEYDGQFDDTQISW
jgi:hypothetical protein